MAPYTYEYPRPTFGCDAVVFAGPAAARQVLLIRRGIEPYLGCWALPGGFVNEFEPPRDAARRELAEETGLIWPGDLHKVGAFADPGRDPRAWSVSAAFVADIGLELAPVAGGDDAAEARWWPLASLPSVAFDHADIIAEALDRLACLER